MEPDLEALHLHRSLPGFHILHKFSREFGVSFGILSGFYFTDRNLHRTSEQTIGRYYASRVYREL